VRASQKLFEHSVHGYVHNSEAQSSRRVCRDCSGTCICSTLVDMKLSGGHPFALLVCPLCVCVCVCVCFRARARVYPFLFFLFPLRISKRQQKKNFITLVRSPCKFPRRDDPAAFIISFYALSRVSCESSFGRFGFARTVSRACISESRLFWSRGFGAACGLNIISQSNRKHDPSHPRRSSSLGFIGTLAEL